MTLQRTAANSPQSITIGNRTIVRTGRWLKIARIFDEVWLHEPPIENPFAFVEAMQQQGLGADLFTFAQALPATSPRFPELHAAADNLAVAVTGSFQAWWDALPQESRKNVRKSQRRGVTTRPVAFTDDLVAGIKAIYDEAPIRQGRRFWHYGKDLDTVKKENASYLDRSEFIGAYLGDDLIGFIKIVYAGTTGRIMQILSRNDQYDKHPTNALLAAAIEACAKRGASHLIYGQYVYGNKRNSSVTEFKRRNGFFEVLLPRYYLPLNARGSVALAAGLNRGISAAIPEPITNFLLDSRAFIYEKISFRSQN